MTRKVRINFWNYGKILGCDLITNVGVATFMFRYKTQRSLTLPPDSLGKAAYAATTYGGGVAFAHKLGTPLFQNLDPPLCRAALLVDCSFSVRNSSLLLPQFSSCTKQLKREANDIFKLARDNAPCPRSVHGTS